MNDFTCGLCGSGPMTEREATAHECGVTAPEPDVADLPMTTREAVAVLANQLANIVDRLDAVQEALIVIATSLTPTTGDQQ